MHRPWEKHLRMAVVLSAVAFAVAEVWNLMAGSAIAAIAVLVALRPLFLRAEAPDGEETQAVARLADGRTADDGDGQ